MNRPSLLVLLLLVGCKSSPPPPEPVGMGPLDHPSRARPPVELVWQEVRRDDTEVELVARIQRFAPVRFPLEVSISLPPGATLKTGRARFTLAPNAENATDLEKV